MGIFKKDWLTKPPHDYELKNYLFLAGKIAIEKNITDNKLCGALLEIEEQLNELYKFKYNYSKNLENSKKITGIDLDLMDLTYTHPVDNKNMLEICDLAILNLEKLHEIIRKKWRTFAESTKLTEIPDKKPTKKQGIVFIILDQKIKVYSYSNHDVDNWRNLKLEYVGSLSNSLKNISSFIKQAEIKSDRNRFWRCDFKDDIAKKYNFEDTLLSIVRYNLFYKLKNN